MRKLKETLWTAWLFFVDRNINAYGFDVESLASIDKWIDEHAEYGQHTMAYGDALEGWVRLQPRRKGVSRACQQKHGQGGDFILYSDRMWVTLRRPITVQL